MAASPPSPIHDSKHAQRVAGAEKRLRESLVVIEKVLGRPIKEIAEKYALSAVAVRAILSRAERDGFFQRFEDLILDALVPKALAVYDAHLQMGSLEAARDVLHGVGVLRKGTPPAPQAAPPEGVVESLEVYRLRRQAAPAPGRQDAPGSTIDPGGGLPRQTGDHRPTGLLEAPSSHPPSPPA